MPMQCSTDVQQTVNVLMLQQSVGCMHLALGMSDTPVGIYLSTRGYILVNVHQRVCVVLCLTSPSVAPLVVRQDPDGTLCPSTRMCGLLLVFPKRSPPSGSNIYMQQA